MVESVNVAGIYSEGDLVKKEEIVIATIVGLLEASLPEVSQRVDRVGDFELYHQNNKIVPGWIPVLVNPSLQVHMAVGTGYSRATSEVTAEDRTHTLAP